MMDMNQEKNLVRMADAKEVEQLLTGMGVRAVIIGCACVVYSSLKLEELLWVRSHHPDILSLIGENGEAYFTVEYREDGPGCVEPDRVAFGTRTARDGTACATLLIDPSIEDPEKAVCEKLGEGLQRLGEVETMVLSVLRRRADAARKVRTKILRL